MTLQLGELFAGYGGLGMGVKAALEQLGSGVDVAWVSDIDKGACKILAHRFPDVPNLGDITKIPWSDVKPIDILTGGFPCQDVSHAGRRAGLIRGETRTGLWAEMLRGIVTLRPRLVVAENVRGLLSARADSDLEPCPWCMGDADGQPPMRALGAVLADLADVGYDAAWIGLPASGVDACHIRFRVFILAWPAADADGGLELAGEPWADQRPVPDRDGGRTLPTPRATDGEKGGPNQRGSSGDLTLPSAAAQLMLPTPLARDSKSPGDPSRTAARMAERSQPLNEVIVNALLPTPAVNDMGDGKTLEWWDEWAPRQQAADGTPAPHGKSLAIEAQRLLQTPSVADAEGGHETRGGDRSDELLLNGQAKAHAEGRLLPTTTAQGLEARVHKGGNLTLLGAFEGPSDVDVARHARAGRLLPTTTGQDAGGSGGGYNGQSNVTLTDATVRQPDRWGEYGPAIARWEAALGRPAPEPTILGRKGNPQLAPAFTEWMMGLPEGWITDVPGLTRNEGLKACGNGVVPQQAAEAIRWLWHYIPASVRASLVGVAA